jgi:hypothetical protein
MKKVTTTSALILFVFTSFAQKDPSNNKLVRHDTTLLKAEECEWIIKPLQRPGETRDQCRLLFCRQYIMVNSKQLIP